MDLAELHERLAEIKRWLDEGLLGGAEPNAADFQIAPSLAVLLSFEEIAVAIEAAGLAGYARGLVPTYPPAPG